MNIDDPDTVLCKQCNTAISSSFVPIHNRRCLAERKSEEKKKKDQQLRARRDNQIIEEMGSDFVCYLCGAKYPINGLDAHIQNCKNKEIECEKCGQMITGDLFQDHLVQCQGSPEEAAWDYVLERRRESNNGRGEQKNEQKMAVSRERLLTVPEPQTLEECQTMLSAMARKHFELINLGLKAYYWNQKDQLQSRVQQEWGLIATAIKNAATKADTDKNGGLQLVQIEELPQQRYKFNGRKKDTCKICFTDLCHEQNMIVLKCMHLFHGMCLHQWLLGNKACPTCRKVVVTPSQLRVGTFGDKNRWQNNRK